MKTNNFNIRTTQKDEYLTPISIIQALGKFKLDPCSPIKRPWDTAEIHFSKKDNGLIKKWKGRVWLNPPYGSETKKWLKKLAKHKNGIALIFARVDTRMFFKYVWGEADAILFLKGRIAFYSVTGEKLLKAMAPSCLIAYGKNNINSLKKSNIEGFLVKLK